MSDIKLITFDPSSSCIGYAVGTSRDPIEFGRIRPDRTRDPAITRIIAMRRELRTCLREHQPDRIRVEVPEGHTHRRVGKASGLSVYGMAVGMVLSESWSYMEWRGKPDAVETVDQNEWTRGIAKETRTCRIKETVPAYKAYDDAKRDPGGDAADAIGLLQDWFTRFELRGGVA